MGILTKTARGLILALAALTLTACASTQTLKTAASQPLPPLESSAEANTFKWSPTINYQLQVSNGFDAEGRLRPDGKATFQESSGIAQISGRCASTLQEGVKNIGRLELRRTFKGGGAQAVGSLLGTFAGFQNPTQALIRQVTGLTAGTAIVANWDAIDFQIAMILSAGHAQCVRDRAALYPPRFGRLVIVMTPMLEFAPVQTLAPGVGEPTPAEMDGAK